MTKKIEYRVDGISPDACWLNPWVTCPLDEFLVANPDDADKVLADLAVYGRSIIGGGAAPFVTIRHGR